MNTIKDCFEIILKGNKNQSRQAARRVRKLVYSSGSNSKYDDIKKLVNDAPKTYKKISESWRQENFVMAIGVMYFLHDKEAQPDFFFPWLFELLLNPSGVIRYAAVRMLSHELGPLTVYVRIPDFKPDGLTDIKPQQADNILFALFTDLNKLLKKTWKPIYKKNKYISSLPVSPYKSIQMVMGEMEELCKDEYMSKLANRYNLKNNLV